MSRVNRKGRSKGGGKFVQLTHSLLGSDAWLSLSPADRCVYISVRQTYDGKNNGMIGLGARAAASLAGISKNTATKCFAVLIERGFIECVTPGGFSTNSRRQTEWRLTDEQCNITGRPGAWTYRKWHPEMTGDERKTKYQSRDPQVPIEGQSEPENARSVPTLGPKHAKSAA